MERKSEAAFELLGTGSIHADFHSVETVAVIKLALKSSQILWQTATL